MVKDSSCEYSTAVLSDYSSTNWEELQYYEHGVRIGRMITSWSITKVNKYAKMRHNNTFKFPWQKLQRFTALLYTCLSSVCSARTKHMNWAEAAAPTELFTSAQPNSTLQFLVKLNLQEDVEQQRRQSPKSLTLYCRVCCINPLPFYLSVRILSEYIYPLYNALKYYTTMERKM